MSIDADRSLRRRPISGGARTHDPGPVRSRVHVRARCHRRDVHTAIAPGDGCRGIPVGGARAPGRLPAGGRAVADGRCRRPSADARRGDRASRAGAARAGAGGRACGRTRSPASSRTPRCSARCRPGWGRFARWRWRDRPGGETALALVHGDPRSIPRPPIVRTHVACMLGRHVRLDVVRLPGATGAGDAGDRRRGQRRDRVRQIAHGRPVELSRP